MSGQQQDLLYIFVKNLKITFFLQLSIFFCLQATVAASEQATKVIETR